MRASWLVRIFSALAIAAFISSWADAKSSGSGFAIGDGTFVVTANHVVRGCTTINIPDVGSATLVKSDPRADLAILRPSLPLAAGLRFRSGHPVRLGEEIVVIGYPLRGLLSSPPTITTGIVSSLAGIRDDRTEMQISAPVQPGNSGGPSVLEADLKNFFGSLSHEWVLRFVEHRVGDPRMISLIRRWLKAGILEDGEVSPNEEAGPRQSRQCGRCRAK